MLKWKIFKGCLRTIVYKLNLLVIAFMVSEPDKWNPNLRTSMAFSKEWIFIIVIPSKLLRILFITLIK